jgi:ABC-type Co2+ transport system permease subunit
MINELHIKEKILPTIVSIFFTVLSWFIINALIIEIELWRYVFIELLLLLLSYFYIFVMQKLHLPRAK